MCLPSAAQNMEKLHSANARRMETGSVGRCLVEGKITFSWNARRVAQKFIQSVHDFRDLHCYFKWTLWKFHDNALLPFWDACKSLCFLCCLFFYLLWNCKTVNHFGGRFFIVQRLSVVRLSQWVFCVFLLSIFFWTSAKGPKLNCVKRARQYEKQSKLVWLLSSFHSRKARKEEEK